MVVQYRLNGATGYIPRPFNPFSVLLGAGSCIIDGGLSTLVGDYAPWVTERAIKGIAIGNDVYVDGDFGIGIGKSQKSLKPHTIALGGYPALLDTRFGEERRSIDQNDKAARGWLEWRGYVPFRQSGDPMYQEIYLHGVSNERVRMRRNSAIVLNLKGLGLRDSQIPYLQYFDGVFAIGVEEDNDYPPNSDVPIEFRCIPQLTDDYYIHGYPYETDFLQFVGLKEGYLKVEIVRDSGVNLYWIVAGWYVEIQTVNKINQEE